MTKKIYWITNHPDIESFWPRRVGVTYYEGPPKDTGNMNADHIGIYTDDDEYQLKPLANNADELKAAGVGNIQKLMDSFGVDNAVKRLSDKNLVEAIHRGFLDHIDMMGPTFSVVSELCDRYSKIIEENG